EEQGRADRLDRGGGVRLDRSHPLQVEEGQTALRRDDAAVDALLLRQGLRRKLAVERLERAAVVSHLLRRTLRRDVVQLPVEIDLTARLLIDEPVEYREDGAL